MERTVAFSVILVLLQIPVFFKLCYIKKCGNIGRNLSSLYVQHTSIADRLTDTFITQISVTGMEGKLKIT